FRKYPGSLQAVAGALHCDGLSKANAEPTGGGCYGSMAVDSHVYSPARRCYPSIALTPTIVMSAHYGWCPWLARVRPKIRGDQHTRPCPLARRQLTALLRSVTRSVTTVNSHSSSLWGETGMPSRSCWPTTIRPSSVLQRRDKLSDITAAFRKLKRNIDVESLRAVAPRPRR